ncbi:MAG: GreA/GreB family elongation factor [Mollicutes bacterium]|nr:GreA/GreB family elongation factor [Mollicutes bacterium]
MEKSNQSNNRVSIGDIVHLNIKFDNEAPENITVKLVERNPNLNREDLLEMSIASPVGKAILNKSKGAFIKQFVINKEIGINRKRINVKKKINIKIIDIEKGKEKVLKK